MSASVIVADEVVEPVAKDSADDSAAYRGEVEEAWGGLELGIGSSSLTE